MVAPYFPIRDELKTLMKLLRDPDLNFHLNELIELQNSVIPGGDEQDRDLTMLRRDPDHQGNLASMRLEIVSISSMRFAEVIKTGVLTDHLQMRVRFDISLGRNQMIIYDGVSYNESPTTLRIISEVLIATLASSPRYSDPDGDVCIVDIRIDGMTFGQNIRGSNIDTLGLHVTFTIEKYRPYDPDIPR